MAEMTEEEMEKARKLAEDKMRTIDFQVDTLYIRDDKESWGGNSGWGLNSKGVIKVNYNIYESGYINDNSIDNYTLYVHEQKHRDNMENGIYEYPMSWEQAYKTNMHDEISATMTELLQLREEYIQTGDISVFDKAPKLYFYKKAIEKGEIKPNSPYKEDFDKEMAFIVNGTRDMWVNNYSGRYVDQNLYFATATYDVSGKYGQYYDENYERAKKIAYNIGGVDFTKYMDKDVEIPEAANSKMIEEIANSPSMQEYYHLTDAQVFEKSGFPPYDGTISLYEYKQLLQHQMAMNNFAGNHTWVNEETGEYKVYSKEEYLKSLSSQERIEKYKQDYNEMTSAKCPNADEMKEEFPTFESFLKYMQSFEVKDYQEQFNEATRNEAFIDKIVEYQAAEYAKTGKDFPKDNPENYQKALNKLYCGAYDVLKPDESNLKSNLSANAKKIADESNKGWFDNLRDKAQSLKHRLTYIKDEFNNEKYVGLWGKIKHKAKQIKEDLTTYREIDEEDGGEWVGKCSIWKGIGHKISSWFKTSPQQEPVRNEPTHPVNKGTPEYLKWSKDKRVSEVQHRQIPDMRKPIIQQPTKSRADEQQNHTSSQTAPAAKMKSDTSKAQVAAGRPKNKSTSSQSKTILKSTMKKDASKAQKMSQNIGKQKTTTPKVAKIGYKGPTQTQMIKNLYHKVFNR